MTKTELENLSRTFDTLSKEMNELALNNGFYEHGFNFGEKLALIHSELSEALEAHRKDPDQMDDKLKHRPAVAVELCDAIIRIMDIGAMMGYPLGHIFVEKHEFNKGRPRKHGKNY